jgi:hypothetical protein
LKLGVELMAFSVIGRTLQTLMWDALLVTAFDWEEEVSLEIQAEKSVLHESPGPLMAGGPHPSLV